MTTIAWDGTTLAADSRATTEGLIRRVNKVFDVQRGWFAGCGNYSEVLAVKNWLCGWSNSPENLTNFAGLIIREGKAYRIEERLIEMPIFEKFHAIGSGRDFALAAMHCGKTAREAVEIAAMFDSSTDNNVQFRC